MGALLKRNEENTENYSNGTHGTHGTARHGTARHDVTERAMLLQHNRQQSKRFICHETKRPNSVANILGLFLTAVCEKSD